jgi:multidrug efflux pump subunit AcrB
VTHSFGGGVNPSEWALKHRSFIWYLMIAFTVAGAWAYVELGRSEDPVFTCKSMLLKVLWPGATINETVDLVTDKLEKKLEEVPNLDFLRSQTKSGETTIYVNLKDSTPPKQVPDIWYQVRKKVSDVLPTLPAGIQGPFFNDEFGDTFGIIYALTSDGFTHREMRDAAEKIRAQLCRVSDINKIDLLGVQEEKIYLEFSTSEVARLGMDANSIIQAIKAPNDVVPAGVVTTDNEQIVIRVSGAYRNEDDLRRINLTTASGFIRLGDVATVVRRNVDPPIMTFRFNGKPAIGFAISMTDDGDMLRLGKAVRTEVAKIERDLPIGLDLTNVTDQAVIVQHAVGGFTKALFEAIAIVLAVSFLALGTRAGLVVAVSIPVVLAMTFLIMWMAGIALQRISLGALIVALGLLVDDAMITIEMMVAKLEEGMDRIKAASFAYTSTAFPMLTGTIVTAAGFIPIGFARSDAGEYSGSLFWVLAAALASSWLVAILFSPLIGVYLLPKTLKKHGHHAEGRLTRSFRKTTLFCMRRPYAVIGGTIALFAISVFGATKLDQQFFPASDRPELTVAIRLPESSPFYATERAVEEIEKILAKDPDVLRWSYYVGSGPVRFYMPLEPPLPDVYIAAAVVVTKDTAARERVHARLAAVMNERFSDVVTRISPLELGPPVGWPIKYRISGDDVQQVRAIAFDVARVMNDDSQIKELNFDWNEPMKVVRVEIEQDKANKVGLTSDNVARSLQAVLAGVTVTQVRDQTYLVDVVGRSQKAERIDLRTVRDLEIQLGNGQSVPLSDLATFQYTDEQPVIWRRKRLPTITVQADLKSGQAAPVNARLEPKMDELRTKLPAGYRIEMGGIVEANAKAQASVTSVVPFMLIIILTVLMMQLQSFQRTIMVISVAPLGLIGVVAIMLPTGTPMGFIANLGMIALVGIIIRNSMILIDQIETNIAAGEHPRDAVLNATMHRVRPILLTAVAAMLAMLPIALDVFWGPMALAMIGGIAGATLLTLVFLPALYVAWFRVPRSHTHAASHA